MPPAAPEVFRGRCPAADACACTLLAASVRPIIALLAYPISPSDPWPEPPLPPPPLPALPLPPATDPLPPPLLLPPLIAGRIAEEAAADDAAFLPEDPMAASPIPPMKLDKLKKEELGWGPAAAAGGGGGLASGSEPSESGSPSGPWTAAACTAACTAVAPAIAASALAQKCRSMAPPGCHIDDDGCVPHAAPVSVAAAAGELLVFPLLPGPPIVAAAAAEVGECCWPTVPPRICVARLMRRMSLAGSESTKPVWKAN